MCFLLIYSGRQVRWMYQPGSHRRKVAQDLSSTFLLRCMPLFFSREGFSRSFPFDSGSRISLNSSSTRFSVSMEMSRLTRDGTGKPVSRDQILRHVRGQRNINFPCSADHEQDWPPYPVDPYFCYCICHDHTYILQLVQHIRRTSAGMSLERTSPVPRHCR